METVIDVQYGVVTLTPTRANMLALGFLVITRQPQ